MSRSGSRSTKFVAYCGLGDYRTQFPSVQIRFSSYSNFSSPRKSVAASDKDSLELEQPLSPKDTAGEV